MRFAVQVYVDVWLPKAKSTSLDLSRVFKSCGLGTQEVLVLVVVLVVALLLLLLLLLLLCLCLCKNARSRACREVAGGRALKLQTGAQNISKAIFVQPSVGERRQE